MANRLPGLLKRRYLDYLTKIGSDLNRPKFDMLRKFVAGELSVSTSDFAQTFFKSEEKDKDQKGGERVVPSRFAFGKWLLTQTMGIL